ncbi:helix-turn-helix domain-containing protein [Streptomyces sp. SPB074]|uniref:helix-turn-helix domain-containing protein n=1 Tax=Streptomyces sp. (strain SPB074) TaxID=465543 RepID=UPI00017F228C|nr:helix-turn-helix transcriptional regulator [Streptomyces sp. SPB074]EDY45287.1 DNA-binding protein [Streptomyces sp. SPB074]
MSATDFQTGREALGARLRELRTEAGLQGKDLAARLGWQRSKISRLETGKQTPTIDDLAAWAQATDETAASDLTSRLRGLESQHRSWRRQLTAGHRAVQDRYVSTYRAVRTVRGYEATVIPGLVQTADYARALFACNSQLHRTPPDAEAAVNSRMARQAVLYEPGRTFRVLIWEGALHALICERDAMAAQLDRLVSLIGLPSIDLGIVPLGAPMPFALKHGFWIYDEARVIVETISSELTLESDDDLSLYGRVWDQLSETAARGTQAHRLIARARASLGLA